MSKVQQAASGGLTPGRLAQATAQPGQVLAGKTFYAGDKQMKTGTYQPTEHLTLACGFIYSRHHAEAYYGDSTPK